MGSPDSYSDQFLARLSGRILGGTGRPNMTWGSAATREIRFGFECSRSTGKAFPPGDLGTRMGHLILFDKCHHIVNAKECQEIVNAPHAWRGST